MYRTILVPVDGSPFAEHALPVALALARRSRAGIHLVSVRTPLAVSVGDADLEEETAAPQKTYLEETITRLRSRIDVSISGEVKDGEVAETLCDLVSGGGYDLIIMATHARSPFGRFWMGSVADEMIRYGPLPLLVVHPGDEPAKLDEEPDLSRVVLPLDGTPLAEQILEPVIDLAGLMPEAEIVLVRAIPAEVTTDEPDTTPARAEAHNILCQIRTMENKLRREAEEYLAAVARRLEARGLRVRTHVVAEDSPAEAILNEAEAKHAGLIALETHARGGLSRLLHGSVANTIVRSAQVPVLVHHQPRP